MSIRPNLRSKLPIVVGMPVFLAILYFKPASPIKRLNEKLAPLNNLIVLRLFLLFHPFRIQSRKPFLLIGMTGLRYH